MSDAVERLKVIEQTYFDAKFNQDMDLDAAPSAADRAAINANVLAAAETFYAAVSAILSRSEPMVENAYDAARNANKAVADARAGAEAIPALLGKLTAATSAATKLFEAAKKFPV